MKLMAALALGCGFVAAPLVAAGTAWAAPAACDGADCVTYIHRGVAQGEPCVPATRYNFGLDASGNTLACGSSRKWIPSAPLAGIRISGSACGEDKRVAQAPDGLPLSCLKGGWALDNRAALY